mgnify:CR=1 FL=1|tara:strand:- start:334 stop:852 length:519 start_codon:yes stop_codon:yes gene_type:complete
MSILAEAITVVFMNATADRHIQGGADAVQKNTPNSTFRTDGLISAISFMDPEATGDFIESLLEVGMEFVEDGVAQDIVVLDQHRGPTAKCDWIGFNQNADGNSIAWLIGHPQGVMAVYDNWKPNNDLSFREGHIEETMKFLREENGLDVYLDLETGQECFRPQSSCSKVLEG